MRDGREAGHLGWAKLEDGTFVNPSDGGCNGSDATIQRWRGWLDKGISSNKDPAAAVQ
jgi:hypothetical protein